MTTFFRLVTPMLKHFLLAIGLAAAFTLSAAEYQIHTWKNFTSPSKLPYNMQRHANA
ncbi:MAG: hypothetical protein VCA36_07560 [Opitutales bacterium]